jgi:[ribosomal protein S5]-alanine N-acetyltransferase
MTKNKILLSKFKISDITENYISWLRDKSIIKFTKIKNTRIEDIINYVQKNISDGSVVFLKILFNNAHVGNIRIKKTKKSKATIAILIGNKRFHNKGIGKAAVAKAIQIIKKDKKIKTVVAYIDKLNYPSSSIFKQNGFIEKYNNITNEQWYLNIQI